MSNTNEFAAREAVIGPNILLASGVYFHFDEPGRTAVSVEDVAHALSNLCRFTGHSRNFYSVAQHAVLVSHLVPPELAYQALHHDDVEAVMGDVSSPLKKLLPEYKKLEREIEAVILFQRGIFSPMPDAVKRADLIALRTEQRDLMPAIGGSWHSLDGIDPAEQVIVPMNPVEARAAYLRRHEELWPEYAARHSLSTGEQTPAQPEPANQTALSEPVGVLSVYMYEYDAGEILKASSISNIWEAVEKLPLGNYQIFIKATGLAPAVPTTWPQPGDLVRYAHGETALALHGDAHAGGWHGVQCMGGYTFYTRVAKPSAADRATWVDCAVRYRGKTREEARREAGLDTRAGKDGAA
ncbi:hypothetical protein [Comamonas odontotermitis]|uniref:hypothetical protein n=1 Tax=Comamonas odontotermitis TaxID=379895 RepID=UPI0037531914